METVIGIPDRIRRGGQTSHTLYSAADTYCFPPGIIGNTVRDIVILTHGLAVIVMHDSFRLPNEDACRTAYDADEKLLRTIGIDTR